MALVFLGGAALVPDVCVIIVSFNAADQLEACLRSIATLPEAAQRTVDVQVVVSDNGSVDDSIARAKAAFPSADIVRNDANLGFARACNIGAGHARAPLLFFFNPDAVAQPGLLREAVTYFADHLDVAMAGIKLLDEQGRRADSCGEFDTWWQAFLRSSAWGELPFFRMQSNGYALRDFDYASERDVDLVVGAAMFIRRDIFDRLGGFDERFFLYHEEIDFAHRLRTAGKRVVYLPQCVAVHRGEAGGSKKRWGKTGVLGWRQRSRRLYWIKHHGPFWYLSLCVALTARYVLYAGAAVVALAVIRRASKS
ncbi:MAG: glycosyltransferase family 2 protein [Candidatus Eremiobacteraeota bacterium]|nr:glycosyltransferase family 2 protein [Candidatus Eremiobacteraeota bacterium]MBC5827432.1 glycosyltransferase family 2 protein [Candidatus Eremiobacteraeota bacterium]